MFAMALCEHVEDAEDNTKTVLIEIVLLKHIELYRNSGCTMKIFSSMYDDFSPSYIDRAKASILTGEIHHLLDNFAGNEPVANELSEMLRIVRKCAHGTEGMHIEFTPYAEYSYKDQMPPHHSDKLSCTASEGTVKPCPSTPTGTG